MQDKRFPIMGRNSSSTGATVRVDNVPCDFILVSAINLSDIHKIMPALRSRISGDGYEVVVNSVMDDNAQNREKFAQFVAQEIKKDTKIPHATKEAVIALLDVARKKAKVLDQRAGISLRLRSLSGILKSAGDWATVEGSQFIEQKHIKMALIRGKMAEEQMSAKYGSVFKASMSDWETDFSNPNDKDAR
jgi:lon-related putative ATP-dependent protease